jgi:hypothetical protein
MLDIFPEDADTKAEGSNVTKTIKTNEHTKADRIFCLQALVWSSFTL